MKASVSRAGCFNSCRYQYKLRYIDGIKTLPDFDRPDNALILGSALHKGIETDTVQGLKYYFNSFPVISDLHIDEAIKLAHWIKEVKKIIPCGEHEVKIENENFIGFIDLVSENADGTFSIWDFKYSNNVDKYLESYQLDVYKKAFEADTGKKVSRLFFVFVPKIAIRQKKTETVHTFRMRLLSELRKKSVSVREVDFDEGRARQFRKDVHAMENCTDFPKNVTRLCDWCEYKQFCMEDIDFMLLPKNERRKPEGAGRTRLWIYGAPFSGKTTLADKFPNPLMLNTDGNVRYVTAPFVAIKDRVEVDGRITKTTTAWEILKDTIAELAKNQNDFKTIILDLTEDCYESCRLYMYREMGITHESDDSFRAWDKVRTEFLSTMRELMNLDYDNIILISHEDTSKDITKRTGDKITSIRPNIQEKIANKIAGMVDVVIRATVVDGKYLLNFKSDEVVFGGGRIKVDEREIENNYESLMKIIGADEKPRRAKKEESVTEEKTESVAEEKEETPETVNAEEAEKPRRRRRRDSGSDNA